jgi:hypothetical protein
MEFKKIYFGFDHYDLSQKPEIKKILDTKLRGFWGDVYPNDNDFLPLERPDEFRVVHPFHNIGTLMHEVNYAGYFVENKSTDYLIDNNLPFLYPIGTAGGPWDWSNKLVIKSNSGVTEEDSPRRYLFKFIKERTKQAIRDKKAFIVLDMSFEGFPITEIRNESGEFLPFNLLVSLYKSLERENLPPEQLIFLHGNLIGENQIKRFNKKYSIKNGIKSEEVIWYETQVKNHPTNGGLDWNSLKDDKILKISQERFEEKFNQKTKNADTMKKFQCLVRRPKTIRTYTMLGLNYYDLLKYGECSFSLKLQFNAPDGTLDEDDIKPEGLDGRHYNGDAPNETDANILLTGDIEKDVSTYLFQHTQQYGNNDTIRGEDNLINFVKKLPLKYDTYDLADINSLDYDRKQYDNTFFSILPETWYDSVNIAFFSEKIFKTVNGFHPFILLSNPLSLKYFRKFGYKTFDIKEEYDVIRSPRKRIESIFPKIIDLCSMNNKELLDWYGKQSDILIHNYYNLMRQKRIRENAHNIINHLETIN